MFIQSSRDTIADPSSLTTFATDLAHRVAADGRHRYTRLPQGLELVMQRIPDGCRRIWRLALAREQEYPSDDEIEGCCAAFDVPDSAAERRLIRCRTHPKTGRRIHYLVVEFTWHEQDPA